VSDARHTRDESLDRARALIATADEFVDAGDQQQALAAYDKVAATYTPSSDERTRELVARALLKRADALEEFERLSEAITGWSFVATESASSDDEQTREHVARALFNIGYALSDTGDADRALAAYDELIQRFEGSSEPLIRERVGWALWNKTGLLEELGRADELDTSYEQIIARRDDKLDPELTQAVYWSVRVRLLGATDPQAIDRYTLVLDDFVDRFSDATDSDGRLLAALAQGLKAWAAGQLGHAQEQFRTFAELVDRFSDAPEPEIRVLVAESLTRMAQALDLQGDSVAAVGAASRVIEILSEITDERAAQLLVTSLYEKGRLLRRLHREAEAIVLFASAVDAYRRLGSADEPDPDALVSAVLSVLSSVLSAAELNQSERSGVRGEDLARMLGSSEEPARTPRRPDGPPSEQQAAALLAQVHAEDCWLLLATTGNDPAARRAMGAAAVELYRETELWLRDAEAWEGEPALAAFVVRNVADGYAMLSSWWSDRSRTRLPLPTRPLFEWTVQVAGLDRWAADQGHALDFKESSDVIAATLDAQREAVAARSDEDDQPEAKIAAGLIAAVHLYEMFGLLRASELGRKVLSDEQLNWFACGQLRDARVWGAWAREGAPDAMPATVVWLLIAQSFFAAAQGDSRSVFPSRALLRDIVAATDLGDWVAEQGRKLPAWLVADGRI
jgi:tetratricopeptide (TPR) repeat protein